MLIMWGGVRTQNFNTTNLTTQLNVWARAKDITKKLEFMALDNQPFLVVEDTGFHRFVDYVVQFQIEGIFQTFGHKV